MKKEHQDIRENETEFLVSTIGKNLTDHKLEMLGLLWQQGFKAEMVYESAPKPQKQLTFALESKIPFIIWLGEDEIKNSIVKIKCTYKKEEFVINRQDFLAKLTELSSNYRKDLAEGRVVFQVEAEKPEGGDRRERGEKKEKGEKKEERSQKVKEKDQKPDKTSKEKPEKIVPQREGQDAAREKNIEQ